MFVNLAPLAVQAGPGSELWPWPFAASSTNIDEAVGHSHPWVVYSVQRLEDHLPMLDGDKRAEHPCQNVPEQRFITDHLGCDLQCGGVHHLHHFRAGSLRSGHRRKVDRLRIGDGGQNGLLQCRQPLFRPVLGGESGRGRLARQWSLRGC